MTMKIARFTFFVMLIAVGLGIAGAASAKDAISVKDETPEAFVHSIYDHYHGSSQTTPSIFLNDEMTIKRYFEPSLAALILGDIVKAKKNDETPILNGDPFVDAQEWNISAMKIAVYHDGKDQAHAVIDFINYHDETEIQLVLVRLNQGWRIRDIIWDGLEGTLRGLYDMR